MNTITTIRLQKKTRDDLAKIKREMAVKQNKDVSMDTVVKFLLKQYEQGGVAA